MDDGASWGPLVTVFKGVTPCPGCPAAVSNPNPVEVKLAGGEYAVLLAFDTMNNPSPAHHGLDMTIWSHDDGETWDEATELAYPPAKNTGSLIGPAVGLERADGMLIFWITQGFLILSVDNGKTWKSSPEASLHGECSIAFAVDSTNGTIIMNCRQSQDHHRGQLYWMPSGDSYVPGLPSFPSVFTDPGCQGSIVSADGSLYTSNAGSTQARERMTIHKSSDAGATWSKGMILHEGPSAYSQLVQVKGSTLGVLFEAGTHSAYDTISFAAFNWTPAHSPNQQWTHSVQDGTLTTDGQHCLDWTSKPGNSVYMSQCDPDKYPHQRWNLTLSGQLTTTAAGSLTLDWTSKGDHAVYMHPKSTSLPHQNWHIGEKIYTESSDGLCLDWLNKTLEVRMTPCS